MAINEPMTFNTSGTYYPMTFTSGSTFDIVTTPVVWNGTDLSVRPVPRVDTPEKPTEWLRRRVEEIRVDLREAA